MAATVRALADAIQQYPNLFVLTGAGISARSGIPTYRDDKGIWLHRRPIQHQEFIEQTLQRQRYWARSMLGWQTIAHAEPNEAHLALAQLQQGGFIKQLVTQNVDNLHQRAGHQAVIDLHGNLSTVRCLDCDRSERRAALQQRLVAANPRLSQYIDQLSTAMLSRPDGDADIDDFPMQEVNIPECQHCRGTLMPDVVFFGGTVPAEKIRRATESLDNADAMLIVGSSLQVYSGFRFCRFAAENNKPIFMINQGLSRADPLLSIKVEQDCSSTLVRLLDYIRPQQ